MTTTTSRETLLPAFPPHAVPQISYGLPFPQACRKHVHSTFHASRVYIISSGSLARDTNALRDLQSALGDKVVGTRIGMKPHTLFSEILEIVHEARECRADLLVTLGAGSLTDGAKIVALTTKKANNALTIAPHRPSPTPPPRPPTSSPSPPPPLLPSPNPTPSNPPTIPILSIPTSLAGGTDATTSHKHLFPAPCAGPHLIILSAPLATLTPPRIWLSTGVRTIDHCVETLCSTSSTPDADAAAERGLRLLVPALLACKADPSDEGPRHQCQMGVLEAMRAVWHGVPLGASHGIGHQLGPVGVGHGETSCVLLPAVCQFNAVVNGERQRRVVGMLWGEERVAGVLRERGVVEGRAELGDVLDAVIRALGLPRTLREVGVGREKLDALAENSLRDEWCRTNPVPLRDKGQVLGILEAVLG